jgi:hypothetical protein
LIGYAGLTKNKKKKKTHLTFMREGSPFKLRCSHSQLEKLNGDKKPSVKIKFIASRFTIKSKTF